MSTGLISSTGLQGVQRGFEQFQTHATRISHYGTAEGPQDISSTAADVVGLTQSELQVKASAKVIETESRMVGSLLKIDIEV